MDKNQNDIKYDLAVSNPNEEIEDLSKRLDRLQLTNKIVLFIAAAVLLFFGITGIVRGVNGTAKPEPVQSAIITQESTPVPVGNQASAAVPTEVPAPAHAATSETEQTQTQTVPSSQTEEAPTYVPIPEWLLPQPDKPSGTVVVVGPEMPSPDIPSNPGDEVAGNTTANEIFKLINKERAANELKPLTYNKDLQAAADTRAKECATLFSHMRPDGSSCHSVVKVDYNVTGENLIKADKPAASAAGLVYAWMNSDGHRSNILLPEYTSTAIGVYEKDGVVHVCQIFLG